MSRDAVAADAGAIAELFNEVTLAEIGVPWTTADEMRDELTAPKHDLDLEDVVLVDASGSIRGYLQSYLLAEPLQVDLLALVHPDLSGRGVNAWLLRIGEERVRSKASERQRGGGRLRVARFAGNEAAARLFRALGYDYTRTFWLMHIELPAPPQVPDVPAGIAIRAFEPGLDDVRVHAALAEGFADHWGGAFPTYEEWRHRHIDGGGSGFDPGLWFVAVEGDEVVGVASCRADSPRLGGAAQVRELAVRRSWRRRGVALALLRTAFGEFHRRGIRRAELTVDAENTTGATLLYERAGMAVAISWEFWEKDLALDP